MKVVAKTRPGAGIEVIDIPEPKTVPGAVKVKVRASGICGTDLKMYLDTYKDARGPVPYPRLLGHEPSGTVVEVGSGVTRFKVGDHIFAEPSAGCGKCGYCQIARFNHCENAYRGSGQSSASFAEYAVLVEDKVHHVPPGLDLETASLMEPLGVAMHAVAVSSLKAGDSALVIGPGPIGLMTALTARAAGAGPLLISGLDADTQRLALARELGFQRFNIGKQNLTEKAVAATRGYGVDVVYDTAGYYDETVMLPKKGG